ncbi:aldo/keto reductase [Streptomyces sp. NPDC057838]|uniref:aldo/keto reductase n=1 Tax=unclassified Streptomyces TaxID=2593676 RepID=UPI0036A56622
MPNSTDEVSRAGAALPVRRLGALTVPAQGLGCLSMSSFYGRSDRDEAIATVHRAVARGVTLFDTADVQGLGEGERLVGAAIAGRRERVMIATKVGLERSASGEFLGVRGDRAYIRGRCEGSLRRLGVDRLDFYTKHWAAPGERIEEAMEAMAELVAEGKVRHVCLSEVSADTIRRAHAVHPVTAVQSEWSLWTRGIERDVLATCRELGIGIIASCPLGRGFLTGGVTSASTLRPEDFRRTLPRFTERNIGRNQALVERLRPIARRLEITLAQLALAWLHHQGDDIVLIPGTARRDHLEENLAAAFVSLTPQDLRETEAAVAAGAVHGERYGPFLMELVGN